MSINQIIVVVVQLLQIMDFLLYWFFNAIVLCYCEIDFSSTLILNKFVCRYLARVKNPYVSVTKIILLFQ
jgi:hypothetical protein